MYYLAIDLGASSGRHMLGYVENGKIIYREVYRFPNNMQQISGHLCWDIDGLFDHIIKGMKKCTEIGKTPVSVAIDSWGVDFVLLDSKNERLGNAVCYRDSRTKGMEEEVSKLISDKELYTRTGIQKMPINTIYQLISLKKGELNQAHKLLMISDYMNFLLCGKITTEYTIATTTGLVSAAGRNWDGRIITACGFPRDIFCEISPPGTVLGSLRPEISAAVGYNCEVVLPASHDTASAVVAIRPDSEMYISSGTWSLMGTEINAPNCHENSRIKNFTNEGGYAYRFRYLRNIMGLWMMQEAARELQLETEALFKMAEESDFVSIINTNDQRFLAPESMTAAIKTSCEEAGGKIPQTAGEVASVICHSLAQTYKKTADDISLLTFKSYKSICIVGGGVNAEYLNRLTEKYTGRTVITGHPEATAMGNLAVQMLQSGVFADLSEARWAI